MNNQPNMLRPFIVAAVASVIIAACSTTPTKPDGAANARSNLTQLQSDSQLASRAPLEIKEAEAAVRAAEEPTRDKALANHLVVMADGKVDIARARAQSRLLVDQRKALSEQREGARLDSRTREADIARNDADSARTDADMARSQANSARADAEIARTDAEVARIDAEVARTDAEVSRNQADYARMDTEAAKRAADDLQRQIAELNAEATERGLVVTLGDVLFATGRSELRDGAEINLGKLAAFLNQYEGRTVLIEGHADNVGSEDSNQGLSQRRADSVKSYLVTHGVGSTRLSAFGKGEGSPIADNDSIEGREQNRRVEVIISNT